MNEGLAGTGRNNGWQIEIDEQLGDDAYGVTIGSRRFTLQFSNVRFDRIRRLLHFLNTAPQDGCFELGGFLSGRLEFTEHDGAVFARVRDAAGQTADLWQLSLEPAERAAIASALEEAILETEPEHRRIDAE